MNDTTQGPWKYRAPQGAFGHEVISDKGLVCQMNHHPRQQKQAKADARLISAAPEMFSALLECEVLLLAHDYPIVLRQVRAALAKAEGVLK